MTINSQNILVFKFGGSSIRNAEQIIKRAELLQTYLDQKVVVVISGMGKTTNRLESVFHKYLKNKDEGLNDLDIVLADHIEVAINLGLEEFRLARILQAIIVDNLSLIEEQKDKDLIYDQIISLGELFSTTIISEYLISLGILAKWMDVRNIIVTDDSYKEAKVDLKLSKYKISKKIKRYTQKAQIVITQGFLGRSLKGYTTTLGREGSDYSAAIFAFALGVKELIIWKDVPGILTADPSIFEEAELIEQLSYREAIEMTYFGAKVLHPKTIQPLRNKQIKLQVRSFIQPEVSGTVISEQGLDKYPPIVVVQNNVILLRVTSNDFEFISEEHLSVIFGNMNKHNVKLRVMRNGAISFTLCINELQPRILESFIKSLGDKFSVLTYTDLQLITVRHFEKPLVEKLVKEKEILFEETLESTIQLVVRAKA